jgi:hypothetical protein
VALISHFSIFLFSYYYRAFSAGKSLAIASLCQLVVRHHGEQVPLELLSHFYATIQTCLTTQSCSRVSHAIIQNTNNIFNLALPGCNVLIGSYVNEIKAIFKKRAATPKEVLLKCALILASLISYPNHLESISCPNDFSSGGQYDFAQVSIFLILMFLKYFLFIKYFGNSIELGFEARFITNID